MRIVVVLDSPPGEARSVVMLPSIDPLARALSDALGRVLPAEHVVLARMDASFDELAARADRLEAVEDPAIEEALTEGAQALAAGELDRAERAFALAESLLAWDHGPRHAEVLVHLAEVEHARGKPSAALLDRALSMVADHEAALRRRIDLAHEAGDLATAAALRRRLLARVESETERAEQLSSIADESLSATIEALEQALVLRPKDPRLLERLQASLEAAGRWREAVNAKVALTETIENPRDRARSFTAAAGMCARRTGDVPRSVALYEAAIADEPATPGAFDAIEAVLQKNEDFSGLASAYERQLERLKGDETAEESLLYKLAELRADRLGDTHGAVLALDRLVQTNPKNVEARTRLAALLEQMGELQLAARCLENAAVWAPTRPETFRGLHRICASLGDSDRDYCACAVLVHLGEADVDEQVVYRRYAPETTVRPQSALDASTWSELAIAEHDEVVSHIVHAIAPAAIELRAAAPRLDESTRHDPEKTTITAVRTAAWAAAILGLGVPKIYARNESIPGGVVCPPTPEPTMVLGKAMLSGRSVPELAFVIGRELASQHLSGRLLTFYPTVAELRALLVAAVGQVLPTTLPPEAMQLGAALRKRLNAAQAEELTSAVKELQARDGRLDLKPWMRSVELASCRAGLVACGDITAAARMLAIDGRVVGGLSAADRVRDLIPFSISEACAKARRAIGIAPRLASVPPPAGS
ncbi:MAG: hypothetical protein H6717_37140 [Polyangiaceae bacterium]|nr:hypothetical protein [Polyangiaceae bacterium]